jgi:hypothetical protein
MGIAPDLGAFEYTVTNNAHKSVNHNTKILKHLGSFIQY